MGNLAPRALPGITELNARQSGIALITAMLIAALVTAGAVALAASQQFDNRRIANILGADRAQLAVTNLEGQAQGLLREDAKRGQYDSQSEAWALADLTTLAGDLTVEGQLRDLQGRFNLTNLSPEPAYGGNAGAQGAAPPTPEAARGLPSLTSPEPAAKPTDASPPAPADPVPDPAVGEAPNATPLPVAGSPVAPATGSPAPNAASPPSPSERAEQQLRRLFQALELDPEPIQAILDWIDPDTETRFPNGAEDDYYTDQQPAYRTGNRALVSVRELLLIKGITRETYRTLAPFVVCLPQASKVNVNTASKEVLMSLAPGLDSNTVNTLIRARETQPFTAIDAFLKHPLLQFRQIPTDNLTVASEYFELQSIARSDRLDYRMTSLLARQERAVTTLRRWRGNFDE